MINKLLFDNLFKLKHLLLIYFFIFSFSNVYAEEVGDKIVLSVADVNITEYEFGKNLNAFKTDFIRKNNYNPTSADIKKWIQNFIDRAYLLADAYKKGFDTLTEVNINVESMEHLVLTQPGGLLDEKMAKEKTTPDEIEKALQAASKSFVVEYLDFENYGQVIKLIGESEIKKQSEFYDTVSKNSRTTFATFKIDTLKWPFTLLGEKAEIISGLKSNDVIFLQSPDAHYYLIHIKEVQSKSKLDLSKIKSDVISFLMRRKQVETRAQYQREIEGKAQILINEEVLFQLDNYAQKYKGLNQFDKKSFNGYLQSKLVSYNFDSKTKNISLDQFIDYYNYLPIRRGITQEADIYYYLQSMVYDVYAYQKAKEYGLTDDVKFILDKENYKKNVVFSLYEKYLKEDIHVSDEELKEKYDLGKSGFTQATEADISIYHFKELNKAILAMISLNKGERNINNFIGLENIEHRHLNSKSTFLSDSIKTSIFSLKVGGVSRPFFSNGKYMVVVKKSESGKRIKEMIEMRDFLIKEIKNEKLREKIAMNLLRLKSAYVVKNEISYQGYER